MSERRKHKSFWDTEEDAKHLSGMNEPNSWSVKERHCNYDDRRYHGLSSSGTSSIQKSMDNSGRASWETNEDNPTVLMGDEFVKRRQDASEVKEIGGVNIYYKDMSPGFDGTERRKCNNSFEDDRSHSHRYPARDRSRSRGRTSGRSRSRSLSRGRCRERERGRGWSRSWSRSRSRSRSRSNDSARGQSRSRSPIEDYRRQSYGWSDRTRGPDKSSQSCRDFVAGSCRRGSQCRFLHPSNISHRDGEHLEDDPAESWRNKVDRVRTSKHAYSKGPEYEMQDDGSEPNRGKDEQFLSKNRNAFPCKDFMRGNCRWANSCKFSHHSSSGESFGKSFSVRSFDKDNGHQSNQYEKPICKFFTAGRCDRNNCRFSHEVINKGSLRDKNNWSDNPLKIGRDAGELSNCCLVAGTEQNNQIHVEQSSPLSVGMKVDNLNVNHQENVTVTQDEVTVKPENEALGEQSKGDKENKASETLDGHGKNEGGNATKDEKGMRLFKNALVEFVKEILKPTWKEGRMSRDVHKTVVKKVVDKVTGTIQADHIPKTQEKVEHYLSCSKPKITKLVQAYVERCLKADS